MCCNKIAIVSSLLLLQVALNSSFTLIGAKSRRRSSAALSTDGDDDLFDYFDPLLSPHAYPNGIKPGEQPQKRETKRETKDSEMEPPGNGPASSASSAVETNSSSDLFFDPTISPHEYGRGTPSQVVGDGQTFSKKMGVLLIDHGSRRPDSNQRLFELARLYQESLNNPNTIVTAAHMEIASPSIQDGIASLMDSAVDEIVCHPYFLSPGRHVQDDIPQLIKEATEALNVKIPITTTDPIGSNTGLMIQAIDGMVRKASTSLDRSR